MQVEAAIRQCGDVHILEVTGALTLGPHLNDFVTQACGTVAVSRLHGLIVNLDRMTNIDSAGLGGFMAIYTAASQRGCRLVLACACPRVRELLQMTRLEGILPCHDTEEAALASFSSRGASARKKVS
jgi:anti-anti-sigma factor